MKNASGGHYLIWDLQWKGCKGSEVQTIKNYLGELFGNNKTILYWKSYFLFDIFIVHLVKFSKTAEKLNVEVVKWLYLKSAIFNHYCPFQTSAEDKRDVTMSNFFSQSFSQ